MLVSCAYDTLRYHFHISDLLVGTGFCLLAFTKRKSKLFWPLLISKTETPFSQMTERTSPSYHNSSWVISSPHGQNGRHLTDDIFRRMFVNENFCILIKISLKFVPKVPIDNKPALVQIMAWRRIGDKPLSDPMLTRYTDAYITGRWVNYNTCDISLGVQILVKYCPLDREVSYYGEPPGQ